MPRRLDGIDGFYRAGVRLFGFVHAGNNDFADSSRPLSEPVQEFHGRSPLGKRHCARSMACNRTFPAAPVGLIQGSETLPAGRHMAFMLDLAELWLSRTKVRRRM